MSSQQLRDRLHRQIDALPESILVEVSDFASFLMARHEVTTGAGIGDRAEDAWRAFALEQFLRGYDDDEVEYALGDALEVYRP